MLPVDEIDSFVVMVVLLVARGWLVSVVVAVGLGNVGRDLF